MKKGTRFIVTTGEYSDFGIRDSFKVLKTFSFDKTLERWLAAHGDPDSFSPSFGYAEGCTEQDFLVHLRTSGLVADERLHTVHLCNYSQPEAHPADDAGDDSP